MGVIVNREARIALLSYGCCGADKVSIMIDLETPVDEILTSYPQLGELFVRMRMLCVGCDIASFHSLTDVAQVYKIDPDELRAKLQAWLAEAPQSGDNNKGD